jgi:hypothetical protein
MRKFQLSRRTLLKGALGGASIAIGLPLLEAMLNSNGTALAQGQELPRRLGIFFWGNGVKLDRWNPAATGANWTFSPALEPLGDLKPYVSVVSGMNIMTGNERGHHAGTVGILSGAPMVPQPHPNSGYVSTFSAASIDQIAAAAIGSTNRFKSLELGISRRVVKGEGTTLMHLSHNGPDSTNPPEYDPAAVFNRVFGAEFTPPTGGPSVAEVTRGLKQSVLDAVKADISSLKSRVGTSDSRRLDQHLENVRLIENQLKVVAPPVSAMCTLPTNPGTFADQSSKEMLEERMTAMSALIAMALACDLTRVFTVMFSGSVGSTVFHQVGVTGGHHSLTHDEPGDQPLVQATTVFTVKQFAILLNALRSITEADGNVLDRCAILASSDTADGKAHSIRDYPILVAGKAGGALVHPGVHYRSSGENTSKVLLTLLRGVGMQLADFGVDGGNVTEGCSAIEA